jgi:hypothetical protein
VQIPSRGKILSHLPVVAIIAASGPAGQLPTSSVVPLLDQLTAALNIASTQLASNAPGDMGANDEDLADLIHDVLDVSCLHSFLLQQTEALFTGC